MTDVRDEIYEGRWQQLVFRSTAGQAPDQARALEAYPRTARVLVEIATRFGPDSGAMVVSILQPGTRLRPHCGATNGRLRIHLGLETDPGARIRVGDSWRS